jgi:hypothetical protein
VAMPLDDLLVNIPHPDFRHTINLSI